MKLRIVTFFAVAALAAALVQAQAPAAAQQPAKAPRLAMLRARMAKALGLSAAQKQQIKTIRQQAQQTAQPLRDQLKQNREALTAAVKAGNAAQVAALSKTQGELMGQALAVRSQAQAQIYAGLTNDQRAKVDTMQSKIQQRLAQRQANRGLAN